MASFTQTRRAERMIYNPEDTILDDRTYNMALGGSVMYGLILNIIICVTLGNRLTVAIYKNPMIALYLIIGYVVCAIAGVLMSSKSKSPVVSFIGYNLVCVPLGLVLSLTVSSYVRRRANRMRCNDRASAVHRFVYNRSPAFLKITGKKIDVRIIHIGAHFFRLQETRERNPLFQSVLFCIFL